MPDNDLLIDEIETDNGSKIGHIILNSPETLNSLTLAMVEGISKQLKDWEKRNSLKAVLIEGAGEKAFCAGGDIRALYYSMIESPKKSMYAEEFFEKEYRLDYQIHKYPKPVISILDGIVMGGGAGLMLGSHYRICTERTRFAMPEIGVGLFPDVGFTFFINKLPEGLGKYMMLTATNLKAADTQFCGLTNQYVDSSFLEDFYSKFKSINWGDDIKSNQISIENLLNEFNVPKNLDLLPQGMLEERLDKVRSLTKGDDLQEVVGNILNNATDDEWFVAGKSGLENGCPTSAHIIWEQCKRSNELTLEEVFSFELNLAIQITRRGDFSEGIRAVIIEKDNSPNWKFKTIAEVPRDWVQEHLEPAWKYNPLEDI